MKRQCRGLRLMMIARTKRWGNSVGVILPKKEMMRLNIEENEDVIIEVRRKDSPLSELFGAGRNSKLGIDSLKRQRKEWDAR